MRCLAVVLLLFVPSLSAQEPPPAFPVAELRDFMPVLAKSVQLLGEGEVEQSLDNLMPVGSPALRTAEEAGRFREIWMKALAPVGRIKLEFESWDVVALSRVSTQAWMIYGVANGKRGPMHIDFRIFRYRGRWHLEGFTFAMNWNREQPIPADVKKLEVPVSYPFGQQAIARSIAPEVERAVAAGIR